MASLYFSISLVSGLLSFASYNLGFAIEKEAIEQLTKEERSQFFQMLSLLIRNKKWLGGLLLTIVSVALYYVALIWAPLVAIAPLSGFGLVVLAIYSHLKLKESFKKMEFLSMFVIIISISFSSLIASNYTTILSYSEWTEATYSIKSLSILGSIVFVAFLCVLIPVIMKSRNKTIFFSLFAGIASGLQTLIVKGTTKIVSELKNQDLIFYLAAYLILVVITAVSSTGALQVAFNYGRVSTSMAIYNGVMTTVPIIYAGVVLGEWSEIPLILKIVLASLIGLTVVSIVILSIFHKHDE
ncbi:MAG: DMT family transporter [Candidatus Heimdallarchaeaceae archaeon]